MPVKARMHRWLAVAGVAVCGLSVGAAPAGNLTRYADAHYVVDEIKNDAHLADSVPPELQALPRIDPESPWHDWIGTHDTEIRGRLALGDEDTLVSWLLFGNSFTSQPRITGDTAAVADPSAVRRVGDVIGARIDDFLNALVRPGTDERRLFARRFFTGNGFDFATPAGRDELRRHLLQAIARVSTEQSDLDEKLNAARQSRDPQAEVAVQSRLFADSGLSLDTSLGPNYAVEQALGVMKMKNQLKPGSVAKVAIIGAGLDFSGLEAGFDFYPVQVVQPFALLDSLRKLGLSPQSGTDVTVLDISPRVIDQLTKARERAAAGAGYTLSLPLSKAKDWLPEFRQVTGWTSAPRLGRKCRRRSPRWLPTRPTSGSSRCPPPSFSACPPRISTS